MRQLKKTKDEFYMALRQMLKFYESNRTVVKLSEKKAVEKTLRSYDDFYEWLQGMVN